MSTPAPRILIAEGNAAEARAVQRAQLGAEAAERYAAVLAELCPGATLTLCRPADADPGLRAPLASFDAMAVTGSALNLWAGGPAVSRQIDFFRAAAATGMTIFGSCWGLQLAAAAFGGAVEKNPAGREVAIARSIQLTPAGLADPMHAGRPPVFDAPAIHGDHVSALPEGVVVTAANANSAVQAARFPVGRGVFWGVQYHPEFDFLDLEAVLRRYAPILVEDGFAPAVIEATAEDCGALAADPARADIAWARGFGPDMTDKTRRRVEILNWITRCAIPRAAERAAA